MTAAQSLAESLGPTEDRRLLAVYDLQRALVGFTAAAREVKNERDTAIRSALRAGCTAAEVAAVTGLGRNRIWQIARYEP